MDKSTELTDMEQYFEELPSQSVLAQPGPSHHYAADEDDVAAANVVDSE